MDDLSEHSLFACSKYASQFSSNDRVVFYSEALRREIRLHDEIERLRAERDRLHADVQMLREQLRLAQKASADRFRDEHRLRAIVREPLWDELCGIDLHRRADAYASACGRDEPNEDDYLAAVRDQLDALIREQERGSTAAAPDRR